MNTTTKEQSRFGAYLFSKPTALAVCFCLGLVIFEVAFFRPDTALEFMRRHWAGGSYVRLTAVLALVGFSVLLVTLFVRSAFASRIIYRPIYFLIFFVTVCTEYALYRAFGRFSSIEDVALTMFGVDLRIGSDAIARYFEWWALIPIIVFVILLWATRRTRETGLGTLTLTLALFAVYFTATAFFTANEFYAPSLTNTFRTSIAFPVNWYLGSFKSRPEGPAYSVPREELTFRSDQTPANNVVFIVDESVQGARLGLNGYEKPTSAFLDQMRGSGFVRNWGIAASGTTCSFASNQLLLTGLHDLPDPDFKVYTLPTIFQYALAMNYKNYYFDGQVNEMWNGKFSDRAYYGTWITASELRSDGKPLYEADAEIARRVKELVSSSTGNFIWINKFGVHPPYSNSYPNDIPTDKGSAMSYEKTLSDEELGKTYDDALAYNLESFFHTLFADGPPANTIFIYTSDHGETLTQATAAHCVDVRPAAQVPLLMIGEAQSLPPVDEDFKASHSNIFATLLDLINVPETERRYPYALSLLKARSTDSRPRYFYNWRLARAQAFAFDQP